MKKAVIVISILLLIFAVGLILFNFVVMPWIVNVREVRVPDLIGKALPEARKTAREVGLNVYVESRRPDLVYPEGIIIIQEPLPDEFVSVDRHISVVVSSGIERVRVPDLSGLTLDKGTTILKNRKFKVQIESIASETTAGIILATNPRADSLVDVEIMIKIIVSKGPERCMPLLEGKNIEEAIEIIKEYDVTFTVDTAQTGGDTNLVILQYPGAGSPLKSGDSVRILISK